MTKEQYLELYNEYKELIAIGPTANEKIPGRKITAPIIALKDVMRRDELKKILSSKKCQEISGLGEQDMYEINSN